MTSQLLVFLSPVLRDEDGAPPASEDSMVCGARTRDALP
jgi:hypothetical protein